jgi:putative ABC transport system ATP-binding protein
VRSTTARGDRPGPCHQPQVLLADEPTGDLDSHTGTEFLAWFQKLNREQGQTILLVTHDPSIAACANREVTVHDGLIAGDQKHAEPRQLSLKAE